MGKPWARLELDWITHRKFLMLDAQAICLWLEGKNYCDKHQTDGMIPRNALQTFRFHSRGAVQKLLTSAGKKFGSDEDLAPLWAEHGSVGFMMHDYLLHNDCRDEVLARIEDADDIRALRREANKKHQRDFRARRKAKMADASALRKDQNSLTSATPTETETETETKETRAAEAAALRPPKEPQPTARSKRPIYQSDRFVVFEWMFDDLGRMLGSHTDDFDLHGFFDDLSQRSRKTGLVIPRDRAWDWLQAEVLKEAQRRKLPMAGTGSAMDLDDVRRQIEQADARAGR